MQIILASQSPRRRQLMELVTPDFSVCTATICERKTEGEEPVQLALRLAQEKAQAAFAQNAAGALVIGCDTVVDLDGEVLGKPADQREAMRMLGRLSGRAHRVHTGVCICVPQLPGRPAALFAETSIVHFSPLPEREIFNYTNTPEPYDKAGGYGIQGSMARFIPAIEGCYYNVMGLPVAALYAELCRLQAL